MRFLPSGKERTHFLILSSAITAIAVVGFVSIYHGYQTYAVVPATFGFLWAGFLVVLWKYCKQSIFQKEVRNTNTPTRIGVASSVATVNSIVIEVEQERWAQGAHEAELHNSGTPTGTVEIPPHLAPCPTYNTALSGFDPTSQPPSYEVAIMNRSVRSDSENALNNLDTRSSHNSETTEPDTRQIAAPIV